MSLFFFLVIFYREVFFVSCLDAIIENPPKRECGLNVRSAHAERQLSVGIINV